MERARSFGGLSLGGSGERVSVIAGYYTYKK